jgi:TIR domain
MSIFLNYRRADSAHALWIYPWLIQWFGRDQVFWDRKDIDPGRNFAEVIEEQIRSAKVFIALVSNNWLSATDASGHRKIDSHEDWIRRETVLALRKKILIIPVLVSGMKAPTAEDLPKGLQKLAKFQMLPISEMSFHDVLRESLERAIPSNNQEPSQISEDAARLQRRAGSLLIPGSGETDSLVNSALPSL